MIATHACYSAHCDVCAEPLRDPDSEAVIHFATEAEARAAARAQRWPLTTTVLVCPERDARHDGAIAELMPAEPQPLNQPTLDGEVSSQ